MESEEELDFVHVISEYYQGIYVVDLAADQTRSIKVPGITPTCSAGQTIARAGPWT